VPFFGRCSSISIQTHRLQKDNWINKTSYVLVQTQVADDHLISDQEIADASKYNKLNITLRSSYELKHSNLLMVLIFSCVKMKEAKN
jgi:hypothetical protein